MGMHSLYQHFPVECRFEQTVYTRYKWGKGWVWREKRHFLMGLPPGTGKKEAQAYLDYLKAQGVDLQRKPEEIEDVLEAEKRSEKSTYNAFETADLIPSLCRLVKEVRQGRNKKAAIKKWVSQYGFLGVHVDADGHIHSWESLADFWREAETLADLWDKFRQVTQRDLDGMREWIRFVALHPGIRQLVGKECHTKAVYWPFEVEMQEGETFEEAAGRSFGKGHVAFSATLEEINRNPLEFYQVAGLYYIREKIEEKLADVGLSYTGLEKISNPKDDIFKLRPVIRPKNLLQAMYLQFYILLCGHNVKVCKWCGKPFDLRGCYNKNREYCSDTCKHSAKSHRYRERQKLEALLKNSST
ncbi:MAG: YdcF family protein [Thermanaeromonas sp.]|uniref:hypothetical protein n=1 Tax=Thermanaeromonas sp. TaxID=2003697 RepID=UPI002438C727|nr:hypothetical protein [Thermanaeromonas sp.]MCG0277778.1 YdcF family protein [Thermanaeromonas sp.]